MKYQRKQWSALRSALPAVPMIVEDGNVTVVSPYATYPDAINLQAPSVDMAPVNARMRSSVFPNEKFTLRA